MSPPSDHTGTQTREDDHKTANLQHKPDPQDFYMFLLRTEQGRDKPTRRNSNLTLNTTTNQFEPIPYDWFWEANHLKKFITKGNPIIIQVLPIPNPGCWREQKLALGFDFSTRELKAWLFNPTLPTTDQEISAQPEIWRECRDLSALSSCWSQRERVLTLSMERFQHMLDFTMREFSRFGKEMLSTGLLRFFEETTVPFHPSMDIVVVIQFAQFLGDFVELLEQDASRAKRMLERYTAYHEFLRDVLLKASVHVWFTSYERLQGEGRRGKSEVSDETMARIEKFMKRRDSSSEGRQASEEHDDEYVQTQQYLQQIAQARLNQSGKSSDTVPTLFLWFQIIAAVLLIRWLYLEERHTLLALVITFLILLFIKLATGESKPGFVSVSVPNSSRWASTWNFWYMDILAGLAALELISEKDWHFLVKDLTLWIVLRVIVLLCQWDNFAFKILLRIETMILDCLRSIPRQISTWFWEWDSWPEIILDATTVIIGIYLGHIEAYTHLSRLGLLWFVLRFVISLQMGKDFVDKYVLPLAAHVSFMDLPYVIFAGWTIHQQEWYVLAQGLGIALAMRLVASFIWDTTREKFRFNIYGHEAKSHAIWLFIVWKIVNAGKSILWAPADYLAVFLFAQWASRAGPRAVYRYVTVMVWLFVTWNEYFDDFEMVMIPAGFAITFGLEWLSHLRAGGVSPSSSTQESGRRQPGRNAWNELA